MGKFTAGSQSQALVDKDQLALPQTPVTQAPVEQGAPAPAPAARGRNAFADLAMAGPEQKPQQADVQAGTDELIGGAVEESRQAQPSASQNIQQQRAGTLPEREWKPTKVTTQNPENTVDGGLDDRARTMAQNAYTGMLFPAVYHKGIVEDPDAGPTVAESIRQEGKTDSLIAALGSVNAIIQNPDLGKTVPDPKYIALGSYITEDFFSSASQGESDVEAELAFGKLQGETDSDTLRRLENEKPEDNRKKFTKSQGNAALGQRIHTEYQRNTGVENPVKLPRDEATVVGDMFKEMWFENNKDKGLITRSPEVDGQVYFQLTPKGLDDITKGTQQRKAILPKRQVKPSKTPTSRTGQIVGDTGSNVARNVSGALGNNQFGNTAIDQAKRNLGEVANVVDVQRGKILLATILPVLAGGRETYSQDDWKAKINNIGGKHWNKFVAADPKTAEKNMDQLRNKVAQEIRAIATDRNGANYLTYYTQAYNGRIAPQQTAFDPTSSKAVRFVTRNAVPAIANPGSRIEKNLRQMYAMMLVKGADSKLPDAREIALDGATPQLEAWGDLLAEQVNATSDADYNAMQQAIADGKPLNDPVFQALKPLEISDPDLLNFITSKGEDGPHTIDGLIDFAKYAKAKRAGKPYASYFNAYMDGKTNGIASNGIQMGDERTALRTGVIRTQDQTLLDDNMDIRDELQSIILADVETNGFQAGPELNPLLTTVANRVFTIRDLHKATTMTFGYGKDIANFRGDITQFMGEAVTEARKSADPKDVAFVQAFDELAGSMDVDKISETLLNSYGPAIETALSKEAIASRSLMRSSAMMHSLMNALMSIETPVGTRLNLGRGETVGKRKSEYNLKTPEGNIRQSTYQYDTKDTSAAVRGDNPGGYAYGGSVPAPVQAIDAMTVALTASGKSWEKLKAKSGGNPYLHTIYDAFKVDAMGYDTVLEEVNENWLDTSMNWSYLDATHSSTRRAYKEFNDRVGKANPNQKVSEQASQYGKWLFAKTTSASGKQGFHALIRQLSGTMDWSDAKDSKEAYAMKQAFAHEIINRLKQHKHGFDANDMPAVLTVGNMKATVDVMRDALKIDRRFSTAIGQTNQRKKKLKEKIKAAGYKAPSGKNIALQYYAH